MEPYTHPHWVAEDKTPLPTLFDEDGYPVILFEPVPQQRRRRVGWDEDRQRLFIALLARIPSVGRAAKAVGMSRRSAYKLLDKPGAEQFAKSWDEALEHGMTRLRGQSLSRCLEGGDFVPVYRKGKLVRIEFRRNDRLAVALLGGQERAIDTWRRGAQTRWRQAQEFAALDAARAAELEAEAQRDIGSRDDIQTVSDQAGIAGEPQPTSVKKSDHPDGGDEPNLPNRDGGGQEARVPPRRT